MDDLEYHQRTQAALSYAYDHCTDNDRKRECLALKAEAEKRIRAVAFKPPLVFAMDMPGYITLGEQGKERTLPHPGLDGLDYAWRIFLSGVAARDTLHASTLLNTPGARPGNALRNCIAKAAEWVEREGTAPALAKAMRRPSLSISDTGGINYTPARGAIIYLTLS